MSYSGRELVHVCCFQTHSAAPGEADRKAFIDLIGKDNINLWRWVKHLVSYTAEERAALPTLQKDGKPEARSIVILDINPWDAATGLPPAVFVHPCDGLCLIPRFKPRLACS